MRKQRVIPGRNFYTELMGIGLVAQAVAARMGMSRPGLKHWATNGFTHQSGRLLLIQTLDNIADEIRSLADRLRFS